MSPFCPVVVAVVLSFIGAAFDRECLEQLTRRRLTHSGSKEFEFWKGRGLTLTKSIVCFTSSTTEAVKDGSCSN